MAQPFLRIDLTNQAKDFQNTVIEAGWPLIDKANANYQILRKWLGEAVAEPERKGEEVLFYLRNESGARIDQPNVLRASDKDLMGPLKGEFQDLVKTLQAAQPKNNSEKNLHAKALQELQALATEQRTNDRRCCLFKYRDDDKKWHLVWAPGYRRKDEQPANPLICTNPACSLLFLQRTDGNSKCPRCLKSPGAFVAAGTGVRKSLLPLILVLLLLVAVLAGAGWWYFNKDKDNPETAGEPALAVTPAEATITQDGQIKYMLMFKDAEGNEKDVTEQTSVRIGNIKVAKNNPQQLTKFSARSTGKTDLEFTFYDADNKVHTAKASLVVEPRRNPKLVTIQPGSLKLGVGTTAQLIMMGEYEDGRKEDLTAASEWNWDDPRQSGYVFVYKGSVEGRKLGKMKLLARYRSAPESEYVVAESDVEVGDFSFQSLHLALANNHPGIGQDPGITVEAETGAGEKMSILGSALLKLEVEPEDLADVQKQPPYVYPLKAGKGMLKATFRGITQEIPFEVDGASDAKPVALEVNPKDLKLAVGEIADLDVPPSKTGEETRYASSDLSIVEVTPNNRLIGKSPGQTKVMVKRGDQTAEVAVEVASKPFIGLSFDPNEVTVRVDDVVALRLMAQIDDDTQVELDPQYPLLEWVRFPSEDYVKVNREALDVRGLQPTGDDKKTLTVQLGKNEATARIRVIPGPLTLALEPGESIEVPVGQKQPLKVFATYGNGQRVEVPPSRVKWVAEPVNGLTLKDGEVTAEQPQAGPLTVSVMYQGETSNTVEIRSTQSPPITFALKANPAKLAVNETGQLVLSAKTPGGQVVNLDMAGVSYASTDPAIVDVHSATGGFRAIKPGKVMLSAKHPTARDPSTVQVEITPQQGPPPTAKPQGVQLITSAPQPVVLPVGVVFTDFRVEANIDGQSHNVTEDSVFSVEGDPESAPLAYRNNAFVGIQPGDATVSAEFNGMKSATKITFQVVDKLELDRILVGPPSVTLAEGENTRLEAIGFLNGRQVGQVTNHPDITWASSNPAIVKADTPVIAAVSEGSANVTAKFQSITSDTAVVRVVGPDNITDVLIVQPSALTLRPGESVEVGRGVKVLRGTANLSDSASLTPANADVVSYDEAARTLKAGLPGTTQVTVIVGTQTANLDVTVLTDAPVAAGGLLLIEPVNGVVAVGEQLPLHVFLHAVDGKRYNVTTSAVLGSSDTKIAKISGTALLGVSPGRITVTAQVPGAENPATSTFDVRNLEFTHLEVNPYHFTMTVGQRLWYEIYAVGPAGRRRLGDDPDLKITHERLDGSVDTLGFPHVIEAKWPTNGKTEKVKVRWKDLEREVGYYVTDDRISGLVVRPADASLEAGDTLDYQIFVRRAGRLDPLSNVDGAEISVANTSIASRTAALRVRGESVGTTEVIAQYAGQQARARLEVRTRTTPVAPPARPIALRIRPDTFQLELGTGGSTIRVVQVNSDGSNQEVGHLAELSSTPAGIVEIKNTASGPVLVPKSIGQTQIHAKLGDLQTETPLLVDVTDDPPGRPRLDVRPKVLQLNVGDDKGLNRVVIIPAQGGAALELPYKITATPNDYFAVENDRSIRGLKEGQAIANVTITDPESKYDGQSNTVIVQVSDPAIQQQVTNESDLELRGPSETTEGSEVAFRVDLIDGSSGQDVTAQATLVLANGEDPFADVLPGCHLVAKRPGIVNVRARYKSKISNPIALKINPLAANFQELVLEMKTDPLGVGETRGYRVWGIPAGGGDRQNLTRLITTDRQHANKPHIRFNEVEPNSAGKVAEHASPNVVGRNPGKVSLEAAIADKLVSNRKDLMVMEVARKPVILRVEPPSITSRVGQATPPLKVLVRREGDQQFRELDPNDAAYVSLDTDVAKPSVETKGLFTAMKPGKTRIRVSYAGLQTSAELTVVADLFKVVELGEAKFGDNTFTAPLTIYTDLIVDNFEYRVYRPGEELPPNQGWKDTAVRKDSKTNKDVRAVQLTSPEFNIRGNNLFRVVIEAREKRSKAVEKYPYAFFLDVNDRNNN